jgi:hypothetical protein
MMYFGQDSASVMGDEELQSREVALQHVRNVKLGRGDNVLDVECDLCWLQREIEMRILRAKLHAEYSSSHNIDN